MAFLVVKQESVATEGASSFISTSGIYPVKLKACEIAGTKNGATQANYIFDKCMSYGNTLIDKNGTAIFGYKIIEALAALLGEDGLSDPEATEIKFKNSTKTLMCIPELNDVDVQVWVQFEYRRWNGEIQESVNVKRFYRDADGASGSEVLSGENIGAQIAKDRKYADEVKYSDGITAEEVTAWKAAQKAANAGGANAAAPSANAAAKAAEFPGAGGTQFPGAKQ